MANVFLPLPEKIPGVLFGRLEGEGLLLGGLHTEPFVLLEGGLKKPDNTDFLPTRGGYAFLCARSTRVHNNGVLQ